MIPTHKTGKAATFGIGKSPSDKSLGVLGAQSEEERPQSRRPDNQQYDSMAVCINVAGPMGVNGSNCEEYLVVMVEFISGYAVVKPVQSFISIAMDACSACALP